MDLGLNDYVTTLHHRIADTSIVEHTRAMPSSFTGGTVKYPG